VLADWARRFPALLEDADVAYDDLIARARDREPQARVAAHTLVDAFLDRVATPARR
jgi:hypothetical protein